MGKFLNRIVVSPLADGYTWYLDAVFQFQSVHPSLMHPITTPKGFETDFASIPSPLTIILPKWSVYGPAAIIHDWLYWTQSVSRKDADNVLLEAMRDLRVNLVKQTMIYIGVRAFGWWAWWENKRLKDRGVSRMRPPNATWPSSPNWHRFRLSPGAWFINKPHSIGPFTHKF
jgi:hypothetical protein